MVVIEFMLFLMGYNINFHVVFNGIQHQFVNLKIDDLG